MATTTTVANANALAHNAMSARRPSAHRAGSPTTDPPGRASGGTGATAGAGASTSLIPARVARRSSSSADHPAGPAIRRASVLAAVAERNTRRRQWPSGLVDWHQPRLDRPGLGRARSPARQCDPGDGQSGDTARPDRKIETALPGSAGGDELQPAVLTSALARDLEPESRPAQNPAHGRPPPDPTSTRFRQAFEHEGPTTIQTGVLPFHPPPPVTVHPNAQRRPSGRPRCPIPAI